MKERLLDSMKIRPSTIEKLKNFNNLPERAKLLLFELISRHSDNWSGSVNDLFDLLMYPDESESPIETILYIALEYAAMARDIRDDISFDIEQQVKIDCESHSYRVDFKISAYTVVYRKENDDLREIEYELIVECDGHDFHQKTKEQVINDNERDFAIKKQGYDVLRFSGSQIFNEPIKCANDIIDYMVVKLESLKES